MGDTDSLGDYFDRIFRANALVAGNIGLGFAAGLDYTVLSLGMTSIPIFVGMIASIGTALFQATQALEKIDGIQQGRTAGDCQNGIALLSVGDRS